MNTLKEGNTAEVITFTKWSIDVSHSESGFEVKQMMISNLKGIF